jgi:hypothetical protein
MVKIKKTTIIISVVILVISILGIGDITPVKPQYTPDQTGNITKLEIIPQYSNIRLQPGENKEIVITVRNMGGKSASISTNVEVTSGYIDIGWINVNPTKTEIPAGGSAKFAINVSVPKDASIGNSNVQITFDNGSNPYAGSQLPMYINTFQLSVDIWTSPKLQIMVPYINGQLESGRAYDYEIKVKNIGDKEIRIDPRLGSDTYGQYPVQISDKSITIKAPNSILAGETGTIKIHVDIPKDARGYYNNYIDLGADDPSIGEGDARISLSFNIWKQPKEPFVKKFSLDKKSDITVELTSNYYNFPIPLGERKEPSFETNIVGPDGYVDLLTTKTVLKGNVNMGSDVSQLITDSNVSYQDTGSQYIITYKAKGLKGDYRLEVLSKNVPGFDYSIITGDNK